MIVLVIEHVLAVMSLHMIDMSSSSFQVPKYQGEGKGRWSIRDICYEGQNCSYVYAFGGPKAPKWGEMIQVALERLKN